MKKIVALVAVLIAVVGCDDGDVDFKNFNFPSTTVSTCTENNLYYKTNGTEAIILEISPSELYNIPSEFDENGDIIPKEVAITTTGLNKIIYRNYNGDASTANLICTDDGLPVTSPNVIEEWTGDGTILISTIENIVDGKLEGYIHAITLQEITFSSGEEDIRINNNDFGTFTSDIGFNFDFGNEEVPVAIACEGIAADRVYKISGNDVLILNFPEGTFVNEIGDLPAIEFSAEEEEHELLFTVYAGAATSSAICDLDTTIEIEQRWRASSGSAIVSTTEDPLNPGTFFHEIRLQDIIFTRIDLTTGETFTLYDVLTPENAQTAQNDGGFLLGTYVTEE